MRKRLSNTNIGSYKYPESELVPVINYDVWVGGSQVTSTNQNDVLGDGKISYIPAHNTLTLNGADIEGEGIVGILLARENAAIILAKGSVNRIIGGTYGIASMGNLTISGTGALTATRGSSNSGITVCSAAATLTISGGAQVTASGEFGLNSDNNMVISGLGTKVEAVGLGLTGTGIHAVNNITISQGAQVTASGRRSGIYAVNGNISISGTNTIVEAACTKTRGNFGIVGRSIAISSGTVKASTASIRYSAMSKAPDLSGYDNVRITAGPTKTDGSGTSVIDKNVLTNDHIDDYHYLKIEAGPGLGSAAQPAFRRLMK